MPREIICKECGHRDFLYAKSKCYRCYMRTHQAKLRNYADRTNRITGATKVMRSMKP